MCQDKHTHKHFDTYFNIVQATAPRRWEAPWYCSPDRWDWSLPLLQSENRSAPQSAFFTQGCSAPILWARESSIHNCCMNCSLLLLLSLPLLSLFSMKSFWEFWSWSKQLCKWLHKVTEVVRLQSVYCEVQYSHWTRITWRLHLILQAIFGYEDKKNGWVI